MLQVFAIFCALVLVATTFISHTVGAMVILPIVRAVGAQMDVRIPCCHSLSCAPLQRLTLVALALHACVSSTDCYLCRQ